MKVFKVITKLALANGSIKMGEIKVSAPSIELAWDIATAPVIPNNGYQIPANRIVTIEEIA